MTRRQTAPPDDAAIAEGCLIARAGGGDRAAFRELYALYARPLFSMTLRFVGNAGAAEELVQDAFVKIWRHAARYDARKSRPFTWASTITRRLCIDHLRKHGRQPGFPPRDDTADTPEAAEPETIRATTELHENSDRLRTALAGIEPNPRRALELALFSAMTHAEIARHLDQPVGTIKSWIRRGLLDLRTILSHSPP